MKVTEKIEQLEKESTILEPTITQRNYWNQRVQNHTDKFLNSISEQKAYVVENTKLTPKILEVTNEPKTIEELLTFLEENVQGIGINGASPRHLGFIPGGGIYPSALGDYIAAVINKFSATATGGPGAVRLENQLLRWLCKIVGYPETGMGNFTPGGSIANLMAITVARDNKGIRSKDVEKSTLYLTKQTHFSIQKGLRVAGMAEAISRYVPVDHSYRMKVSALRQMIESDLQLGFKPFLVIASAGTTETGAIDPLDDIANIAQEYNLWYHIDAAYGGFFLLVDDLKSKFKGIERSDSLVIDPHKGFFLPYGIGALLVKNIQFLYQTYNSSYNYRYSTKIDVANLEPLDLSPELSRHFRGLRIWLPLHLMGLKPFKAALEEKIWLCRYFYEKIKARGWMVGPFPDLSVAIYRYVPEKVDANDFNQKLVEYVIADGRVFLSFTTLDGVFWIRLAVLSFRTHLRDIELCLEILDKGVLQISRQLAAL